MRVNLTNLLLFIGLIFFSVSCIGQQTKNFKQDKRIEKIIIFNSPTFLVPSLITWDAESCQITFQRIASKEVSEQILTAHLTHEKIAPSSVVYTADSEICKGFLKDSLAFDENDFQDHVFEQEDGIFSIFTFIFDDGTIADVEFNEPTENQVEFIDFLIDQLLLSETDSITYTYLNKLKRYY